MAMRHLIIGSITGCMNTTARRHFTVQSYASNQIAPDILEIWNSTSSILMLMVIEIMTRYIRTAFVA